MSQHQDRRIHADALRRHYRFSQAKRFKRQAVIMMASVALGGLIGLALGVAIAILHLLSGEGQDLVCQRHDRRTRHHGRLWWRAV